YNPYASPYVYGPPSQNHSELEYRRALAEEQAARQAYADACRAQEDARSRAARARLARQAYDSAYGAPHSSYLSDEDDEVDAHIDYGYGNTLRGYGYNSSRQRAEQQRREFEQQRKREVLQMKRAREERSFEERRKRLLEEERVRMAMLEEEERRRRREAEARRIKEQERIRMLEEEHFRRQQPELSPLEELFDMRPSRFASNEPPNSRRARTASSVHRNPEARSSKQAPNPNHTVKPAQAAPQSQRVTISSSRPSTPSPNSRQHTPSRSRADIPISVPSTPPSPSRSTLRLSPERHAAAEKIQSFWRRHGPRRLALRTISELNNTFESLKATFSLPCTLEYQVTVAQGPTNSVISVPTDGFREPSNSEDIMQIDIDSLPKIPKLAYTPTNTPVHMYEEQLSRILTRLDDVQSGGDKEVRRKRRELARKVETEAERIEWVKMEVWKAWDAKQHQGEINHEQNGSAQSLQEQTMEEGREKEETEKQCDYKEWENEDKQIYEKQATNGETNDQAITAEKSGKLESDEPQEVEFTATRTMEVEPSSSPARTASAPTNKTATQPEAEVEVDIDATKEALGDTVHIEAQPGFPCFPKVPTSYTPPFALVSSSTPSLA
ncbi:hypothetical protein EW026_g3399, partial [Hermanssonia centrifuga]